MPESGGRYQAKQQRQQREPSDSIEPAQRYYREVKMSDISGGGIIARMLKIEGVDKFFGIVDGTYTHLFVSAVEEGLKMITPRHESVAAHMAGAYARVGGGLGVCIASNGPGVANMLSGACVENLEGNRVLLITSSRRQGVTDPDRPGAYQQFDQHKAIREISKWSVYIRDFERIPDAMREALRRSWAGKPGLVHVDVPENVINGFGPLPAFLQPAQYRCLDQARPNPEQVRRAASMLALAQTPLIHTGSGVIHSQAYAELAEVAALLNAPVTSSWAGNSALPDTSDFACPIGLVEAAQLLRNKADLVLCVGAGLGETDWWGKHPYWAKSSEQKFIQVDVDPANLGRNRKTDLAVVADAKLFLRALADEIKHLPSSGADSDARGRLLGELAAAKLTAEKSIRETMAQIPTRPIHTLGAVLTLRQMLPGDTVFVLDGGNTPVWAQAMGTVIPNSRLSTWHMGHLGTGPGYAMGAAEALPGTRICLFTGDGAMGFHMQELETAARYGLKILFVVIADRQWGMVKINQMAAIAPFRDRYPKALGEKGHVNGDFGAINWRDLAVSMGVHGEHPASLEEFGAAVARCAAMDGPSLIQVDVDPQAHMMCPALQTFKDLHNEPQGD